MKLLVVTILLFSIKSGASVDTTEAGTANLCIENCYQTTTSLNATTNPQEVSTANDNSESEGKN